MELTRTDFNTSHGEADASQKNLKSLEDKSTIVVETPMLKNPVDVINQAASLNKDIPLE